MPRQVQYSEKTDTICCDTDMNRYAASNRICNDAHVRALWEGTALVQGLGQVFFHITREINNLFILSHDQVTERHIQTTFLLI